jgi:hypothetical protein
MSKKDINKDEQSFTGDEKNEGFLGTPDNYFESFSSRLFSKIKANDELNDYPLLASLAKQNPFAVPAGYFDAKEELLQYPLLSQAKQKGFVTPAAYFEALPAAIARKIALAEEVQQYETLSAVSKAPVFAIPANYFEDLAQELKEVVSPAKLVPLYARVIKQYKFAVAAAVLLIITLSIVLNQDKPVQPAGCSSIACLSKKDIISSGVLQNLSEESIIEMIDVSALTDSLTLKKDGVKEKISSDEVSGEIDINTLTEEL